MALEKEKATHFIRPYSSYKSFEKIESWRSPPKSALLAILDE